MMMVLVISVVHIIALSHPFMCIRDQIQYTILRIFSSFPPYVGICKDNI